MAQMFIDQTTSELRLHKILYLLKYLRAMILNSFGVSTAAILYMAAGIRGIYPLGDNSLMALIDNPAYKGFFWLFFIPTMAALAAWFSWIYYSVINLNKRSLRMIAIFTGFSAIAPGFSYIPQVLALTKYSGIALPCIAFAYFGFFVTAIGNVAADIWKTSNTEDSSAFRATLDRRLAPTMWVYFNKLVDLPRTPLRNWRILSAYLTDLFGTLMLISSLIYMLNGANLPIKIQLFYEQCGRAFFSMERPYCEVKSQTIINEVAIGFVISVFGFFVGSFLQSFSKKFGSLSAHDVLQDNQKFTLYLRAFGTDDIILPKPRLPLLSRIFYFQSFPVNLEQELFDVTDGYRPLIAVGNPTIPRALGGVSYREYVDDDHWQDYVASKIEEADNIVVVLRETRGVYWEASKIVSSDAVEKTLFLFDPTAKDERVWDSISQSILPLFYRYDEPRTIMKFKGRSLGFFFNEGEFVEVMNSNWTATSYRTAFSYFLTEKMYRKYPL